jgi:hypothetical protein
VYIFSRVEKAHTKVVVYTWKFIESNLGQAYNDNIKDCDNSKSIERWRRKTAGLQHRSYGSRVAEEIINLAYQLYFGFRNKVFCFHRETQ